MTAKRYIKNIILTSLAKKHRPIIIASMGRSGSTLVFDSVVDGAAHAHLPFISYINKDIARRVISDGLWNPHKERLKNGVIYKTHALAEEINTSLDPKIIFIYGTASDAALSVISCKEKYGTDWIKEHLEHLRATGGYEDIPYYDVLRFSDQIEGWWERNDLDRIFIKYEALWDCQKELSRFCGFPVSLPPQKARTGTNGHSSELVDQVQETYHQLDRRIKRMPNFEILETQK